MDAISLTINQIEEDEFHRTSAVLAVNKEQWMTSHDVVNIVRKKLRTRKVGHAGALDPFATGVLIILVGKYTKLSDAFLESDKEYKCRVLVGVSSSTQDIEGNILEVKTVDRSDKRPGKTALRDLVMKALGGFKGGYDQRVPVFSSVKVDGKKLRVLARKFSSHKIDKQGKVHFLDENGDEKLCIKLPMRPVKINRLELLNIEKLVVSDLPKDLAEKIQARLSTIREKEGEFLAIDLIIGCSKGTYVRQFAEDLGAKLGLPAMLLDLERTKSGDIAIDDCIKIEDIPEVSIPIPAF